METNEMFDAKSHGETLVVTPLIDMGELSIKEIKSGGDRVLKMLKTDPHKNVIIDLGRIDLYGSTALGVFVRFWKTSRRRGGRLAYCNVSASERKILEVTRLDSLGELCQSFEDALAAVSSPK